ncbi:phosphate ABC transporter permease subunit PstC [bacterium]|nr:phosphate ABC transporter permease subunit PstC [bacterium]
MRKTSQLSPEDRNIRIYETLFSWILKFFSVLVVATLVGILATILIQALPSFRDAGINFYTGKSWDPVFKHFSATPFVVGTLATTVLALLISIPFSLSIALFSGFYLHPGRITSTIRLLIDLLAGIPSVIYGFWGLSIVVPAVRQFELFSGRVPYGVGIFTAALILSIMIVPYAASIGRDVIALVPSDLKEAGLALGATPYEVVRWIVMPYSKAGLLSGILLSFGRAIGETMAVTMVIGNANKIPGSIFDPANTISSIIANEFAEATDPIYVSHLIHMGLILFITTTAIGLFGRRVIKKWSSH